MITTEKITGLLIILVGTLFLIDSFLMLYCLLGADGLLGILFNIFAVILGILGIAVAFFLNSLFNKYHIRFLKYAANLFSAASVWGFIVIGLTLLAGGWEILTGGIMVLFFALFFIVGLPFFGKSVMDFAKDRNCKIGRIFGLLIIMEPIILIVIMILVSMLYDLGIAFLAIPIIIGTLTMLGGISFIKSS